MSAPDRWSRIQALYRAATEQDAEQRAAFLDAACEGDVQLRLDLESLLAQSPSAEGFLSEPAVITAAWMITSPGSRPLI
jgi:hypothetical protein